MRFPGPAAQFLCRSRSTSAAIHLASRYGGGPRAAVARVVDRAAAAALHSRVQRPAQGALPHRRGADAQRAAPALPLDGPREWDPLTQCFSCDEVGSVFTEYVTVCDVMQARGIAESQEIFRYRARETLSDFICVCI